MPPRRRGVPQLRAHAGALLSALLTCGAALAVSSPALAQHDVQHDAHPGAPACAAPAAGQHLPTVDDVVRLRGEKFGRTNPFGAYDLSHDGSRVAVQIRRPIADAHAHATSSFFWLHADVGVYDTRTSRRIAYLGGADRGDNWAAPFWSPSGQYLAVTHVGPASLDRQMYAWDVGHKPPARIVPGALATSLRIANTAPNGRAGAYAWINSDEMVVATIPDGSGTLDKDDATTDWPRRWQAAESGKSAELAVSESHLPPSIAREQEIGVPLTLWRVNVRTGARRALLTVRSVRGRTPRDVLVSHDARWVAFTPDVRPIDASAGPVPPLNRAETELLLVNLNDGRVLHPLPGRHVTLTRWSADDSTVGARLVGDTVVQVRRDGTVDRPNPPVISPATRARPSSQSAAAAHADTAPRVETRVDGTGERLVVRRGSVERTIIAVDSAIARLAVCRPWYLRYATQHGDTVFARVTVPPGFSATRRYPVIVQIYPGTVHSESDMRADTGAYVSMSTVWEPALLAAHGYVVLEPSIPLRGGGADRASEFPGDILPAIDSLVARGVADPDRLGLDGVSFGGYGTAMVIAQTNRFRAASVRYGLYDLISMYGQFGPPRRLANDAGEHLWAPGWAEGGQGHLGVPPYGNWSLFQQASPLAHVESIHTPVLIVAGDMDYAAPMAQGEEFFTALDRLGKPVRFVRYIGEGHGNASAPNMRDLMTQMTRWFDAWLMPGGAR